MSLSSLFQAAVSFAATLTGVFLGFRLNSWRDKRKNRKSVEESLQAIKKELELNEEKIGGIHYLISQFQNGKNKYEDRYLVEPLSVDAWNAALRDNLAGELDEETYNHLVEIYHTTKVVNEMIKRTRTEWLALELKQQSGVLEDKLGDVISGGSDSERGEYTLSYYTHEGEDEMDYKALAVQIKRKSWGMKTDLDELQDKIEEEIEKNPYSLRNKLSSWMNFTERVGG